MSHEKSELCHNLKKMYGFFVPLPPAAALACSPGSSHYGFYLARPGPTSIFGHFNGKKIKFQISRATGHMTLPANVCLQPTPLNTWPTSVLRLRSTNLCCYFGQPRPTQRTLAQCTKLTYLMAAELPLPLVLTTELACALLTSSSGLKPR